eukprot:2957428-Prymnesium_polylepis.1
MSLLYTMCTNYSRNEPTVYAKTQVRQVFPRHRQHAPRTAVRIGLHSGPYRLTGRGWGEPGRFSNSHPRRPSGNRPCLSPQPPCICRVCCARTLPCSASTCSGFRISNPSSAAAHARTHLLAITLSLPGASIIFPRALS